MKFGVSGPSAFLAIIAVFTMAVAPPIGFFMLIGAFMIHGHRCSKIRRHREAVLEQRRKRQRMALILAYKSLP